MRVEHWVLALDRLRELVLVRGVFAEVDHVAGVAHVAVDDADLIAEACDGELELSRVLVRRHGGKRTNL